MEERRKIVIPTGIDPEETLSRHYFDTEATLAARPVVPLSEADAAQGSAVAAPRRERKWMVPAALIAVAVAAVGIAAGFAISSYGRRQQQPQASTESSLAVRPLAEKTRSTLPWTHTPDEPLAEAEPTADVANADQAATPEPNSEIARHENQARADAANDKKRENEEAAREAQREEREQQREERIAEEREQRRQERERRRARNRERDDDLPQDPIRRSQDEIHRVREIFEGTP